MILFRRYLFQVNTQKPFKIDTNGEREVFLNAFLPLQLIRELPINNTHQFGHVLLSNICPFSTMVIALYYNSFWIKGGSGIQELLDHRSYWIVGYFVFK